MKFKLIAVLLSALAAHVSEAREYYKADITFNLSRTSAESGTVNLPGTYQTTITWSDDGALCEMTNAPEGHVCSATWPSENNVTLVFSDAVYQNLLVLLGAPSDILEILVNHDFTKATYQIGGDYRRGGRFQLDPKDPTYSYHLKFLTSLTRKI
jgi:hypothetical protein